MPVSAAGEPATMLYNGVELPNIDTVWTNKTTHPYAVIGYNEGFGYQFTYSSTQFTVDENGMIWPSRMLTYHVVDDSWASNGGSIYYISPTWSNYDLFRENGTMYLAASNPVPVYSDLNGRMVFSSEQVADDFASFVLQIVDLSDTTAAISYGYKLYSGGVELRSVLDDESLTGSNGYIVHSTLLNLDPETEYEIIYTLYANGELTHITASTTFTTLASSGSGGGSDPDYSGQLNGIQQGIGEIQDSVDDVGSKVDDIQDTLTETKEEITSLPGKIVSGILDGIKTLFVPSEEDLIEISESFSDTVFLKFGFIGQCFGLLTDFVSGIEFNLESGEAHEFNFPGVKLPMQGEEFILVPETTVSLDNALMDVLRPVLGTVVSMIAVISFVNMAHDYFLAIVSGVSAYQFERRKE